jgi:hypothetical protein
MRDMRLRCAGGGLLRTVDAAGCGTVVGAWLWARVLSAQVYGGIGLGSRLSLLPRPRAREFSPARVREAIGSGGWSGAGA